MKREKHQDYENHRLSVPMYYRVLSSILIVNILWSIYKFIRSTSLETLIELILACGLGIVFYYLRVWPLRVQDRLIRLEMRMRLVRVLPEELALRIDELTLGQLIALRFASDEELPELCQEVLEKRIMKRDEIKKRIKNWEPDHLRI